VVKATVAFLCAAAFGLAAPVASGNTMIVNGFRVGGWGSWETRSNSGGLLIGANDSSLSAATYFNTAGTTASDTAIQKQIIFMDPGQTAKAAGGQTLPADPSGSLNGLGYVRLDGTSVSSGKSDLSYVDLPGIAAANVLDDSSFAMAYRYYMQPYSAVSSLQLNISVHGTDGADYTLTYFQPGATTGWNTASVTNTAGSFGLIKKGAGAVGGAAKSLDTWFNDPTYGSVLFGQTAEIFRVGFTAGTSQSNVVEYLDWAQTSLLNGGDVIDFTGPSASPSFDTPPAAPLPSSAGMGCVMLCVAWGGMWIRKKRSREMATK
jgi:hypothetical protein